MRLIPLCVFMLAALAASCSDPEKAQEKAGIKPTYDKTTGKLKELTYDSNHDGKVDTWTEMDGARPLRTRIDRNEDGKLDRWEYYDAGQLQSRVLAQGRREAGCVGVLVARRQDRADRDHVNRRREEDRSVGALRRLGARQLGRRRECRRRRGQVGDLPGRRAQDRRLGRQRRRQTGSPIHVRRRHAGDDRERTRLGR